LPFIIGGAALAFVIVVVLIIVAVVKAANSDDVAAPSGSGGETSAAAEKASDAVKGYLEALAAGKSEQALAYLDEKPSDTSLMTDEVLQASNKAAPITAITVPEVNDKYVYSVQASYKIGDRAVNAKFSVDDSSGHYLLSRAYTELDLSYTTHGLPVTINGAEVKTDKVYLFPGTYQMATSAKYIDLGSGAAFTVQNPSDYPSIRLEPTLTSEGQKVFKEKVTAAINKCVASHRLKGGCGLDLASTTSNGYKLKDGTVDRKLTADAKAKIKKLKGELDYSNPTLAEASGFYASVDTSVDATKGGQSVKGTDVWGSGTSFDQPSIDMSDSSLTVEWD
jgi:hypothetical protein